MTEPRVWTLKIEEGFSENVRVVEAEPVAELLELLIEERDDPQLAEAEALLLRLRPNTHETTHGGSDD